MKTPEILEKGYRRHDEIGTPVCITVDFESLEDGTVTIRDRDTMEQERLKIEDLEDFLKKQNNVIRSFVFNTVFYLSLIIFSSLLIILYPFLKTISLQKLVSIWVYLVLKLLKVVCRIDWEIEGRENLINYPCIIVSNHQGPWESLFLQTLVVPSTSIVKKELLFIPFFWVGCGLHKAYSS